MAVLLVRHADVFQVSQMGGSWAIEIEAFFFLTAVAVFLLGSGRYRAAAVEGDAGLGEAGGAKAAGATDKVGGGERDLAPFYDERAAPCVGLWLSGECEWVQGWLDVDDSLPAREFTCGMNCHVPDNSEKQQAPRLPVGTEVALA